MFCHVVFIILNHVTKHPTPVETGTWNHKNRALVFLFKARQKEVGIEHLLICSLEENLGPNSTLTSFAGTEIKQIKNSFHWGLR